MTGSTKQAFGAALKQMMKQKPIDKITVKDLVVICGVNRQTFYYHFDDIYDLLEWVFEEDASQVLPKSILKDNWKENTQVFFDYLSVNASFALNVYNSNSRTYMLRFLKEHVQSCIRSYAEVISDGRNIDRQDFDFVIEFYSNAVVGLLSQWLDRGLKFPPNVTEERIFIALENSVESILGRFTKK